MFEFPLLDFSYRAVPKRNARISSFRISNTVLPKLKCSSFLPRISHTVQYRSGILEFSHFWFLTLCSDNMKFSRLLLSGSSKLCNAKVECSSYCAATKRNSQIPSLGFLIMWNAKIVEFPLLHFFLVLCSAKNEYRVSCFRIFNCAATLRNDWVSLFGFWHCVVPPK